MNDAPPSDAPRAAISLPLWRVERILSDKDGLLVIDKPIGMPVHGGDESLTHSVVARLGSWLENQGRSPYLGVHQRLDQDTSGVLLFVTDERKNAAVAAAVEERHLRRVYRAVVGPPREREKGGRNRRALSESGSAEILLRFDGQRASVVGEERGMPGRKPGRPRGHGAARSKSGAKHAVTKYRVISRSGERALVELELQTGRTHQIRATMAHLGFPVVGDHLYGGQPGSRMMLHALELSGGPLKETVRSEVPESFQRALDSEAEGLPKDLEGVIADAAVLRAPLLERTDSFRLINGEGDGLPGISADVYGEFVTLNLYDAELHHYRERLAAAITSLGYRGVHEKRRVRADLRAQDAAELAPDEVCGGESAPDEHVVVENGMKVLVSLNDGLSTGLFLDMRDNRFRVREWARGGRVLNLFCYTSSFSVSAALASAKTTSVDLSAKALARSRRNFEINGLDPAEHRFFKEDAMKFLARAGRRGDKYDLIVLDPPSFATVGKGTFSVKSRYAEAVTECMRILAPRGRLLCVTNHTKTTPRSLHAAVEAAGRAAERKLRSIKALPSPLDCPADARGPWPSKSLIVELED